MSVRLAAAGWGFFVAENVVLSENRSKIIELLDDDEHESKYHLLYGSCSTLATATIVYSWFKCKQAPPFQFRPKSFPGRLRVCSALVLQALGFIGLTQMAPRLQVPFVSPENTIEEGVAPSSSKEARRVTTIRCPFDFTPQEGLSGIERVSRHSALWSMAFVGLGQAAVTASIPLAAWYTMPTAVALIGGGHHDSRFKRGIGGNITPELEARTSNVPFVGMVFGDQTSDGGSVGAFTALGREIKGLNMTFGVCGALLLFLRRIR